MKQIYDTMKEGEGRFINRKSITAGKVYDSFFIYVPTEVARDTSYPFKEGEKIKIRIEGKRLIIEKAKQES